MQVHSQMWRRLLFVGLAILLVCNVFVDAVEEKVSHTSEANKLIDAQAKLRQILDNEYTTSRTKNARISAKDYNLEDEVMDIRFLKKAKKESKVKAARTPRSPTTGKTPRPVAPTSGGGAKGAKGRRAPNGFIGVR